MSLRKYGVLYICFMVLLLNINAACVKANPKEDRDGYSKTIQNVSEDTGKYPDIVAAVGPKQISAAELAEKIESKKQSYENLKMPQAESYYEKVALGLIIENALIDQEAEKQNIFVSLEEASGYLKHNFDEVESLNDNEPIKIAYYEALKTNGFDNPQEYINSPKVILAQQRLLVRARFKAKIEENNKWDDYIDRLINDGNNYEIFINTDIKGYREMEKRIVLEMARKKS